MYGPDHALEAQITFRNCVFIRCPFGKLFDQIQTRCNKFTPGAGNGTCETMQGSRAPHYTDPSFRIDCNALFMPLCLLLSGCFAGVDGRKGLSEASECWGVRRETAQSRAWPDEP